MAGVVRAILVWTGRFLAGLVALVVILALAGAAYEAMASRYDATSYPPPGRLVDIGGYRLHLNCQGSGHPVVVFDAGLGGTSLDWTAVQPEIARTTRACAYDRAGMGWSDTGPAWRSPQAIAAELHHLLIAAKIEGPYVLVGHSLGGKNVRMFARDYPRDVAGMVLVDARSEYMDFHASAADRREMSDTLNWNSRLYRAVAAIGIPRLVGARLIRQPNLPDNVRSEMAFLDTRAKSIDEVVTEARALTANDRELAAAPSLGDRPLSVLASGNNLAANADWRVTQRQEAGLSRGSHYVVANGSGHYIQLERPALVIGEVRRVVAEVRRRSAAGAL